MGSTKIYLTRHGETEWNLVHRMQGSEDSPLTPRGLQQAEWLRKGMHTVPLDAIYSSPSPRAVRTAELVRGERSIPLETSEDFMEMGFGLWEGSLHSEVAPRYPEQWDNFWKDPEKFELEGSETYGQVQARALHKLQDILEKHEGQSVLIVTHTITIKLLMAYFEGKAMKELWGLPEIHPTSLCRIDITDGIPDIVLHGDISHYEE
ncbi:histidine phosphatase family protein [Paenibacillus agri]|uniref:Histidine phosphatase family protein n=1 Tax=Paenibacillus agri TaxID=2744309 RepID=A0A850EIZ1_9BACL|nr:histidine phosphatase family protein [Paenibacillus agri]NUU59387.1 histidine phosphatase family protein [Paenibacillus agri]